MVTIVKEAGIPDWGGRLVIQLQAALASVQAPMAIPVANLAKAYPKPTAGQRAFVSDATATTFASVVVGGGAHPAPVYYDGTDWRIG